MGFLIGISSSCAQSALSIGGLSPSSVLARRNGSAAENKVLAMCNHRDGHGDVDRANGAGADGVHRGRRNLLLVGISVLPLLQLKATALEGDLSKGKLDQLWARPVIFGSRRGAVLNRKLAEEEQAQSTNSGPTATQETTQPPVQSSNLTATPDQERSSLESSKSTATLESTQAGTREEPETAVTEDSKDSAEKEGDKLPKQEPSEEMKGQSGNSFLSLLNSLGLYGSGILGALYARSQKEKAEIESTIALMQAKFGETEKETFQIRKNYEEALMKVKDEQSKRLNKFMEEEAALLNKLNSTKRTIESLGKELNGEKMSAHGLKSEIARLEGLIAKSKEDKSSLEENIRDKLEMIKALEDKISSINLEISEKEQGIKELSSALSTKEAEFEKLKLNFDATKEKLQQAISTIEQLKGEISSTREELSERDSLINSLNEKILLLDAEKSEMEIKIEELIRDYENLRVFSEKRASTDLDLLTKKDENLRELEEKLSAALAEINNGHAKISELERERDETKFMLEKEAEIAKNLQNALDSTKEALEASKLEASKLFDGLGEMKKSYEELLGNISLITNEFSEEKKILAGKLEESNSAMKALITDLTSVQDAFNKSQESLAATNSELTAVTEDCENLKMELVETYKKLESANLELKEEKKLISTMNKEIEALVRKINADSDVRKALESDLDEATRSLDEMNKSAMLLSRELENTNGRNGTLEAEKAMLLKALNDEKDASKHAKENLEDAQNVIDRLGGERESLELRVKRLEEELASAKGEILRLRRHMSMNEAARPGTEKGLNAHGNTPFVTKRTTRRRKGPPGTKLSD
ncbi:MAR-binding filament-like protein 1 isoform X1 [Carex littledalei]|uniref:MAR-binding filament-like protein 1 isoform X1 n=1 Tax=Carex littledalei TaxID=544730 RepID=A0A833V705_9POAL|nr:MAR-binding filament-like protein 1 isoform X1 [Carex littledalei]